MQSFPRFQHIDYTNIHLDVVRSRICGPLLAPGLGQSAVQLFEPSSTECNFISSNPLVELVIIAGLPPALTGRAFERHSFRAWDAEPHNSGMTRPRRGALPSGLPAVPAASGGTPRLSVPARPCRSGASVSHTKA